MVAPSAFVVKHLTTLFAVTVGLLTAALVSYFREQISKGIRWALNPVTKRLPWNQNSGRRASRSDEIRLISLLTLVDVYLEDKEGRVAKYQKTSVYRVVSPLTEYREGVTAAGTVFDVSTAVGSIVATRTEHGFHVSTIDLGDLMPKGRRFQNVYTANLINSFTNRVEYWTQEVAIPTKYLSLRIHFPKDRPPTLVKCGMVSGLNNKQIRTEARSVEISDYRSISWDIPHPELNDIYKLQWHW